MYPGQCCSRSWCMRTGAWWLEAGVFFKSECMLSFQNVATLTSGLLEQGVAHPLHTSLRVTGATALFNYASLRSIKRWLIVILIAFFRLLVNLHIFACVCRPFSWACLWQDYSWLLISSVEVFGFSCLSKVFHLFILFRVYFAIKCVAFLCSEMSAF